MNFVHTRIVDLVFALSFILWVFTPHLTFGRQERLMANFNSLNFAKEDNMKNSYRVVIIHGAYGDPGENWFPWLKEQLESKNYSVIVPKFPTPEGQEPKAWLKILDAEVGEFKDDVIMVGHSIGVALILHKLELLQKPIRAAFLVSAFVGELGLKDFDPINALFFEKTFDWNKIRKNGKEFFIYNGDNDPYVPLTKGEEIAKHLHAKLQIIKGGGHINASAGFLKFDKLLRDILSLK
jgi:hypothetical protein